MNHRTGYYSFAHLCDTGIRVLPFVQTDLNAEHDKLAKLQNG